MRKVVLSLIVTLLFSITTQGQSIGEDVSVEWRGKWYPFKITDVSRNLFKISYNGYSSKWDEWVGGNRVKF